MLGVGSLRSLATLQGISCPLLRFFQLTLARETLPFERGAFLLEVCIDEEVKEV
jgi:hypothetical protein